MALTYRSPLEENVAAYDTSVQSLIASTSASYYKDFEANNFQFFNYYLNPVAKQKLITAGLYLSPYSAMPHSHPACKTLENYFLYTVIAPLLDNRFFFIGIKNSKIDLLKSRNSNLSMINKLNRYVTSADRVRYGSDFVIKSIYMGEKLARHESCLEGATLKDLVPKLCEGKAKHIFLHDELHYWKPRDLITFLELVKPDVMYATLVYPAEILGGASFSLHPWCYKFNIVGGKLIFYPDGVQSESYEQPLSSGFLLEAKRVVTKSAIYMVDVIQSKFAHHLVALTRTDAIGPTYRSFGPFDATSSTALNPLMRGNNCFIPVSFEVLSRVYRYLRTLKKPDVQSAMAKLSQLLQEPKGIEIKFVEDFARLVIGTNTIRTLIKPEVIKQFLGRWLGKMPHVLAVRFSSVAEVSLDEFVSQMEPFTFQVKLVDVDWNYHHNWDLFSKAEEDYGVDVCDLLNEGFIAGVSREVGARRRAPYQSIKGTGGFCDLLTVSEGFEHWFCIKICLTEVFSPTMEGAHFYVAQEHIRKKFLASMTNMLNVKGFLKQLEDSRWFGAVYMKALDRYARFREECFLQIGVKWFFSNAQHNVRFLTNQAETPSMPRAFMRAFSEVMSDVTKRPTLLRRRRAGTPSTQGVDREMPAPVKVEEPVEKNAPREVDPDESGNEKSVPVEEFSSELCPAFCKCGLDLELRALLGTDLHGFRAPDDLGNRKGGWYSTTGVDYKYNGGHHKSQGWPKWLTVWMQLNEIDCNYYDCCLFQVYNENGRIGYHSDDEPIFETGASILTCNLKGQADFSFRCDEGSSMQVLNGPMSILMPEGFQLSHKHAVCNCTAARESVTFRRLAAVKPKAEEPEKPGASFDEAEVKSNDSHTGEHEDDVEVETEVTIKTAVGTIKHSKIPPMSYSLQDVPGDGNCFWHCLSKSSGLAFKELKEACRRIKYGEAERDEALSSQLKPRIFAEEEAILAAAVVLRAKIIVLSPEWPQQSEFTPIGSLEQVHYIEMANNHFQLVELKNACVVRAVASALNRRCCEVLKVLDDAGDLGEDSPLLSGQGVELAELEHYFALFGIAALVVTHTTSHQLNVQGAVPATFRLHDGHIDHVKKNCQVDNGLLKGENIGLTITSRSKLYVEQCGSLLPYAPDEARAKVLADCLLAGNTGVLNSSLFNNCSNLMGSVDLNVEHENEVACIFGTFGCGKSTVFKKFFNLNPGKGVFYISPRRALADEFKGKVMAKKVGRFDKLRQKNWSICTFEIFLKKRHLVKPGMAVILDELQLYPPGYLDLVMLLCPKGVYFIVGGDPCQSDYDNEMDRPWLGSMISDCDRLLGKATYKYNMLSQRFKNENFLSRLHCRFIKEQMNEKAEHLLYSGLNEMVMIDKEFQEAFLVSSFDEKKIVSAHFDIPEHRILTFGESTGLNFKMGTVIITNVSSLTSEKRWVTALSRFSNNICFVNLTGLDWQTLAKVYVGRSLSTFLCACSKPEDIVNLLPGKPIFMDGYSIVVGKDEGLREEKMQGDPWLKGMIDLFQIEDVEEVEEQFEELQEEWFKTHLPREELESVRAKWVHNILAKEFREVRMGFNVSEQFTDEYPRDLGQNLTNQAERFETIYPRHRANDTVTFLMAVKKRLRFSSPAKEKCKLLDASVYGKFMLDEFLSKIPLKKQHDRQMMEQAKKEFEDKKTSKSAATIENHSGRSCRDWLIDIGLIFSKSQLCTKFDNRFRVAKAAQSIVCFQHEVLCRFAPYMRYIEKKLHEVLPERYYVHSGKGLEELNSWVIKGGFGGVCTESDYEAFDASQDQYMVAFEVAVMEYLGLPRDLIEDYKFIKTHLGSKLGNFAIMRFSGEASTFLFNTMANMLFTFLKYEIKGHEFICFAGDDMCASERLATKHKHVGFLSKLKLKAKVFMVSKPTFCGWNLCPDGIYKKPQLVMERMCIAKEKANLANCIDNYAIEVSYAYKLGEKALNRMDEEEAAAFYNCVRIIVKNKHLLKSDIRNLYEQNELA
ncbi:replicase [Phlox virus S]|uniref:ORF1 protein n=1 Tax=Phlox virus S TaxID=436066 RepID=A4ZWC5_9VIRU|nr:replicase [Phlox virus S]ABP37862.1 replicase [Phlox virus S]